MTKEARNPNDESPPLPAWFCGDSVTSSIRESLGFRFVHLESNAKWLQFLKPVMEKIGSKNEKGFWPNPSAGRATLLRSRRQTGAPTFLSAWCWSAQTGRQKCRRSALTAAPQERCPTSARLRQQTLLIVYCHFCQRFNSGRTSFELRASSFVIRHSPPPILLPDFLIPSLPHASLRCP